MSAENIACITSPSDLVMFVNYETEYAMVTSFLEYEAMLRRDFKKCPQTTLSRDQSLDSIPRRRHENTTACSLPVHQSEPYTPHDNLSLS
jgi:hypothetical protein